MDFAKITSRTLPALRSILSLIALGVGVGAFSSVACADAPEPQVEVSAGLLPTPFPGFRERPEAKEYAQVCDGLYATNKDDLALGGMEARLLCGDSTQGPIGRPWSDIPPNQAAYFARGFFQTRGYHHPEFIQDGERLYAKLGSKSVLKSMRLLGGPVGWQPPTRRLVKGEPLTPTLLNDLQGWALSKIKDEGYACAEATIQADPDTEEAVVFLKTGERKRITALEETGETGLREGALDRYNAFIVGDWYKDRMVALTRRRTLDDGFLQTLVLTTKCGPGDNVTIVRDVTLGPSRTVRIGVGGSTSLGARALGVVRQARIGSSASSIEARLQASYLNTETNQQSLSAKYRWFYLHGENRYSLIPEIRLEHEAVSAFDVRTNTLRVLHNWTFDTTEGQYDLNAGPNFTSEFQSRGQNPHYINIGFLEMEARWTDHDFEWFNTSPRTGSYIDVTTLLAMQSLGSPFSAQKFQIAGEKLWTIGAFDPPLFVLGMRFNVASVFSPNEELGSDLPVRFRSFLGGETDLRGYGYRTLPRDGIGSLSAANASVEGRLHKVLFRIIDVFSFVDAGLLGRSRLQFDTPVFISPGAGVRWESPVGVLRLYLARSFTALEDPSPTPYGRAFRVGVTFGEEF